MWKQPANITLINCTVCLETFEWKTIESTHRRTFDLTKERFSAFSHCIATCRLKIYRPFISGVFSIKVYASPWEHCLKNDMVSLLYGFCLFVFFSF